MTRLSPIALLLALAGCAAAPAERAGPVAPPPERDTCRAAEVADLVGAPATALERRLLLAPVRMIPPGTSPGGAPYSARLNIVVDDAGRIARLYCG